MRGPLSLGNNEIYGVNDPVTNKSAANKQYVDNKKAFFSDGVMTTDVVNIRNLVGNVGFFSDVTFHSGVHCQDIDSSSPSSAIVNKNVLQTGGLFEPNSFIPTIEGLLSKLASQKIDSNVSIAVVKGTVGNYSVLHKDNSFVNNITFVKVGKTTS